MKKFLVPVTSLLVMSLSGCSGMRDKLGLDPVAPDEFTVYDRAPLSVPPKYALRPPVDGAKGAGQATASDEAQKIVDGGKMTPPQATETTAGAEDLLAKAGAEKVDADIRTQVDEDLSLEKKPADKKLLDGMLFWKKKEAKGEVIDPVEEKKRLEEEAKGKPAEGVSSK